MKWSLFCLAGMLVFVLNSCNKTTDTTPDYQKMFSCKVNGQLWVPVGETNPLFGVPVIWVVPLSFTDTITINASRTIRDNSGVRTTGENIDLRYVNLKLNAYAEIKYADIFINYKCGTYVPDTTKLNFIKTTGIDTVQRMISGIFQVECNDSYCHDNIKITEGRFSVKY